MANQDTKIQFTAQGLQEIKTSAISLMREMVTLNESYNKSSLKSLQILREQIILLREQKKILSSTTFQKGNGDGLTGGGNSSSIVTAIEVTRARLTTDNDILLIQVREINSILKTYLGSSGTGIGGKSGRTDVEEEARNANDKETKSSRKDPYWTKDLFNLMNHLVSGFKSNDYAETYTKLGQSVGGSINGAFGGFGAAVGVPLMLGSIGAEALIDAYDKRQKAARGNVQLFGGTISGNAKVSNSGNYSNIGYSYMDTLQEREMLSKALGRRASESQIKDAFVLQRGVGLDTGTTGSLLRLLRGTSNRGLSSSGIVEGVRRTQGLGGDWSSLDEHLQVLIGLSEQQVQEFGKTNIILNNEILGGVSKLSEDFKNPINLQNIVNKLTSGTQQAQTPQFQALQYRTLQQIAPSNSSVLDLTKIMKDPTNKLFGKYMEALMNNIYKTLGVDQAELLLNSSQFNMSFPQIKDITKAWKNKGHISLLDANRITNGPSKEMVSRSVASTTSSENRIAETANHKGELFDNGLDSATEEIIAAMKLLDGIVNKFTLTFTKSIKDVSHWIEKLPKN